MRLTLRTMLAYLDDILEPEDAKALGEKIKQSEFASGLVHRIRSATRKLRLGAPELAGKGIGGDPNSVAEYLDNTLNADRISDFEKVCLESDVHLAETAACHQILTLVLGEAAEVDPKLREKIYRIDQNGQIPIPREGEPEKAQLASEADSSTSAVNTVVETQPMLGEKVAPGQRDKPDYMRRDRAGFWLKTKPYLITGCLLFLLTFVAIMALGPLNKDHVLYQLGLNLLDRQPQQSSVAQQPGTTTNNGNEFPDSKDPGSEPVLDLDSPPPTPASKTDDREAFSAENLETAPSNDPVDVDPSVDLVLLPTEPEVGPEPETNSNIIDREDHTSADDAATPSSKPLGESTDRPAEGEANTAEPDQEPSDNETGGDLPLTSGVEVGRFVSDEEVLLKQNTTSAAWMRVPARNTLFSGQRYLVLPAFRPQIVLTSEVQMIFLGEGEFEFEALTAETPAGVSIHHGRLLMFTGGDTNVHQIELSLGARHGMLTFSDADAVAAIEMKYFAEPGIDPAQQPAFQVCQLIPQKGLIQWQEVSEQGILPPIDLSEGQIYAFVGDTPGQIGVLEKPPAWVDPRNSISNIDRLAIGELEEVLEPERAVSVSLQERKDYRKAEVRSLAARGLAYIQHYDALVNQFSDQRQRSYWKTDLLALRQAVAQSPQSAQQVREALEKKYGERAERLYRMLWGFSPQQLADGDAQLLVESLESETMAVRVVAYWNLEDITDKTHRFRPEREPEKQKRAILDWQKTLEDGGIEYKTLPQPLPDFQVRAEADIDE